MTNLFTRLAGAAYNAAVDLRFGRLLGGSVPTRFAASGAKDTANSDYRALARLFDYRIGPDDVLVDVGCGKGRVINFWLRHCDNPIVGIELDPDVAAATRDRFAKFDHVTIFTGDVLDNLPVDGTLFYLYNPFQAYVMEKFARRLADHAAAHGGPITVIYNNCKYLEPFGDPTVWSITLLDPQITDPYDRAAVIEYIDEPPVGSDRPGGSPNRKDVE